MPKTVDEIVAIVPAHPGYEVYYISDGAFNPPNPVVAFAILKYKRWDGSFFLMNIPITAEYEGPDLEGNGQKYALKRPDGSFDFPFECTLGNRDEAEAYIKQGRLRGVTAKTEDVNKYRPVN